MFRRASSLLIALAIIALAAPIAHAHDVLVDSNPKDGAHLEAAPAAITLEFNNDLLDLGSGAAALVLTNDDGTEIANGPLSLDGREASFQLPALDAGSYRAAWSVVSSDGHRIQGALDFAVGESTPTVGESTPTDGEKPTPQETTPEQSDFPDTFGFPRAVLPIFAIGIIASMVLVIIKLKRK